MPKVRKEAKSVTDANREQLIKEIGQPMYDGLAKLRENLKKFGWMYIMVCEESNADRVVIEAKKGRYFHWFQVDKNGDIAPCVTYMRCK